MLDTLKLARALRDKAGLGPEQAEGFADAVSEALQGDVATKGDLREATQALRGELQAVRSEIREVKLELESKIEASKYEVIKLMLTAIGFQTLVIVGALIALALTLTL